MVDPKALPLSFSRIIGVGGGGDGGFLVMGPDGHITKIPPWNPEVIRQVTAALKAQPEAIKTLQAFGLIKEHM